MVTRKMSAEELTAGVGRSRCADDDMRTREMAAIERDELLRIEARERPPGRPGHPRRPTARTQRIRIAMIALPRPVLPTSLAGRVTAALASLVVLAVVLVLIFR